MPEERPRTDSVADDGKFPDSSSYRDVMFAIAFIIHLIAVIVILVIGVSTHSSRKAENDEPAVPFQELGRIFGICLTGAAVAFGFAFFWLYLMKRYARQMIYFTLIASVIFFIAMAIICFAAANIIGGIILLVCALFHGLIYYLWRPKIPFAAAMLTTVAGLLRKYPAPSHFAYGSLLVQIAWIILWVPTFSLAQQYEGGTNTGLSVFLILSFFWTSQVIKNVIHVTASGLFASWYFLSGTVGMPSNPTLKSFKRATTTSFGSICFGSLLVAVLKTLRQLLNSSRNQGNYWVRCILDCLLSILENLMSYFNMYAFTQVAIYGKTYCQSAKDTWRLIKSHGIDAVINDNLISGVLLMGSILAGILCAVVGGLIALAWAPAYWVILAAACFVIGVSLVMLTMEVVESGVATIFVCFAMDAPALQRTSPELYRTFTETYHGVLV